MRLSGRVKAIERATGARDGKIWLALSESEDCKGLVVEPSKNGACMLCCIADPPPELAGKDWPLIWSAVYDHRTGEFRGSPALLVINTRA